LFRMSKKCLLYISMLGTPDVYDPAFYADLPDTGDDQLFVANRLREWGVSEQINFRSANVTLGDDIPDCDEFDAVIVGGSFHSMNENQPWQKRVVSWLTDWQKTRRPALGICAGHQLMCRMAGVDVVPRSDGANGRSDSVTLTNEGKTHSLFDGYGDQPVFHFGNYEHVVETPAGSTVLATGTNSPALAIDHGGNWLSIQFHPEILHDYLVRVWLNSGTPEFSANYYSLPDAPRVLVNYVRWAGLLSD